MNRIALFALIIGIILAFVAYYTDFNDLPGATELRAPGFVGYILIISALGWFSLNTLHQWGRESRLYYS
ncbi:hypothetical protein DVR12_23440 [Chitinophaga silvatica]|uniref:Uncharacterized protein n=1 Tax=Chitinophaga silvatica TaxID=2282649 RepID=A0A3E1Y4L6_9BACT|nr:hypothetical protein [Chitinophaga silvatica]RFS19586.1 hypothetical protein DVR12_23440 [Chitinophaga silvatica]